MTGTGCARTGPRRSARGHRGDLPEVTSCTGGIAARARRTQHGAMHERLRQALQPLNLAAAFTLAAIGYGLRYEVPAQQQPLAWLLLGAMLLGILALDWMPRHPRLRAASYLVQAACAFALIAMAPRTGIAPVTLVILVAELAMEYRPRTLLVLAALLNAMLYAVLLRGGHAAPHIQLMLYIGFQSFAALTTHYARTAELARDRLAQVNADLLATRALLADSARDNERLRVARELHDVAGHKLTAMTLNLRALAADPAFAGRHEIALAQQLSSELLSDIRGIVQAMRDERGLDLGTALRALAAPLPRPSLRLRITDRVHVTDPAVAETVLRLVQEALTNSARHADADVVKVDISSSGERLLVHVEDDGQLRGAIREGNGLSGMRERVLAAGGELTLSRSERGALRIDASLPA
ncbi:MAG TPA: histidine kinase [Lysobacter sp.]